MPIEAQRLAAHTRIALALIWLTPLLWTVNQVSARIAPGIVAPHVLAFGRWSLAGLVLTFLARQELWRMRHWVLSTWYQSLVLGACGMWICGAWVYIAGQSTSAMNISLIYASSPIMIAVGSVWLGESFSKRQILGVVLALVGVAHPDFGEVGVAVVIAKAGAQLNADQIIANLKSQLANFKIPKKCFVVPELPRNTMGKVQKNLLRDQYKGLF